MVTQGVLGSQGTGVHIDDQPKMVRKPPGLTLDSQHTENKRNKLPSRSIPSPKTP